MNVITGGIEQYRINDIINKNYKEKMNSFGGKFKVEVTHFVNPYKFFIKLEDSPHFFEKQLNNLITAEATKLMEQYSNGYSPKTNEYVIIYNAPAKTWNRAICEHVVRINKYIENEFILWNIDNGYLNNFIHRM